MTSFFRSPMERLSAAQVLISVVNLQSDGPVIRYRDRQGDVVLIRRGYSRLRKKNTKYYSLVGTIYLVSIRSAAAYGSGSPSR